MSLRLGEGVKAEAVKRSEIPGSNSKFGQRNWMSLSFGGFPGCQRTLKYSDDSDVLGNYFISPLMRPADAVYFLGCAPGCELQGGILSGKIVNDCWKM